VGDTTISWCDKTWNPIRGCSRVSAGCVNCYAERVAARFSDEGQPYQGLARRVLAVEHSLLEGVKMAASQPRWTGDVRFVAEHLADPLRWKKPRRIFVNSMSDLFHERLTNEQIAAVFGVMAACPQHTFQVLTKRAKRMREWFGWVTEHGRSVIMTEATQHLFGHSGELLTSKLYAWWRDHHNAFAWPLPNVWLGVSVENQAAADARIPELLRVPASVRFLSCEPLIGDVDLHAIQIPDAYPGLRFSALQHQHDDRFGQSDTVINWVIGGCESGPGARPCDVSWLRSLRDQCADAGVPYFLKQARKGTPAIGRLTAKSDLDFRNSVTVGPGSKRKAGGVIELPYLDGVQHAAFPARTGAVATAVPASR
jgi:protein gp37